MFDKKEMAPLLSSKHFNGHFHNGKITSCQVLIAGLLVGVVLGSFISTALFSFFPTPSASNSEKSATLSEILPSIKDPAPIREFEQGGEGREYNESEEDSNKFGTREEALGLVDEETEEEKTDHAISKEIHESEILNLARATEDEEIEIPGLRLHEGTREITELEKNGGWRFTPDVLKPCEHFKGAQVLSESEPKVVMYKNFLSQEEIDHVLELASSHMTRSQVVGGSGGEMSNVRTSYGAWLNGKYSDDVVKEIEIRIHDAVGLPHSFGEGIYVLRQLRPSSTPPPGQACYLQQKGETFRESCGNFLKRSGGPECGEGHGGASCGDRIATFILFLKSPKLGGETLFPKSRITETNLKKAGRKTVAAFADACQNSLYFKLSPHPGDAVLFWDYVPRTDIDNHETYERSGSYANGDQDTEAINDNKSLHGGCPVLEGEKWIATRWIRSTPFN